MRREDVKGRAPGASIIRGPRVTACGAPGHYNGRCSMLSARCSRHRCPRTRRRYPGGRARRPPSHRTVQRRRHTHFRARRPAHLRGRAVHRAGASRAARPRRGGADARPAAVAERARRNAALPGRGRGRVRPLGGRAARGDHGLRRAGRRRPHYLNDTVNYTEPLFVVVIMALASTRPIVGLPRRRCGGWRASGGGTPAAWWVTILTIGPLLGLVHHRAGRDDHLRPAARPPVLRPAALRRG